MPLEAEELAEIRETFEDELLTDTCEVYRKTAGTPKAGVTPKTFTLTATYPCRVQHLTNPTEGTSSNRQVSEFPILVSLPHDAIVNNGDRLEIGDLTLEVTGVTNERTDRFTMKVYASEVK